MLKKYFGTDGVRGPVGQFPITPDFFMKLGWALGSVLSKQGNRLILIGKDTRISGYMFESALQAGLTAAGVRSGLLGPIPTPAIAYLTRTLQADAGIVISASHNAYQDNGIKFFSNRGAKLSDEIESQIEAKVDQPMTTVDIKQLGKAFRLNDAPGRYIEFCKSTVRDLSLHGKKIVLDCAHGATYLIAPAVFRELGAEVVITAASPDGFNINLGVGSMYPDVLRQQVLEHKADVGIAFDGDGDRLVMVDEVGEVVNGDELLCVIALHAQRNGVLKGGVVGTLMSNLGLERALQKRNIPFVRTKVGDRYVAKALKERGWSFGGESSGHLLVLNESCSGDGIISALQVMQAICVEQRSLSVLKQSMHKYPQVMINVSCHKHIEIDKSREIQDAVRSIEKQLGEFGRVLLRKSGTEPLVRVMVEGVDFDRVQDFAKQLACLVKKEVGYV